MTHQICYIFLLGILSFSCLIAQTNSSSHEQSLKQENERIANYSKKMEQFYELKKDEKWRDITDLVLASPYTSPNSKQSIQDNHRRIIIFKYPSDGLWIKGFISFTPHSNHHPLLILYRWGNENFALMNPGVIFATYGDYIVLSSALRGGVSNGKDEFGGADVDDMKNLMEYFPQLIQELGLQIRPTCVFMLGPSRGGLEMFLTLARFPELQNRVDKIVALSAILDLHNLIQDRPNDMKKMFQTYFGLSSGANGNEWIAKRDPLNTIPYLKKSLPILVVQGTADNRISLDEGRHMVKKLEDSGHDVNYWEVPNGTHVLLNNPHIMHDIVHWLESNSPCMSLSIPVHKSKPEQ